MKKNKRISVVIPVKGTPSSLQSCLRGFLNQSSDVHEIIVVGSKDYLIKIKNYIVANEKKRIIFLNCSGDKNEARNIGFLRAKGDYVLYADDDMVPQENLIEECTKYANNFDALIIPEQGISTRGYLSKIYSLEKKIVSSDPDALTPRLFRRSLFKNSEMPFDKKFGALDEWGFNFKLKAKKPNVGTIKLSLFTVIDHSTLTNRIKKSFKKGLWIRNLIATDKKEALRRINPIKRGVEVYGKKLNLFIKNPIIFSGLIFIKFLDFFSFISGYLFSFFNNIYINQRDVK